MAEIALILGSLGAAYIASNRKTTPLLSEGYRNPNANNARYLPNMSIPTTVSYTHLTLPTKRIV